MVWLAAVLLLLGSLLLLGNHLLTERRRVRQVHQRLHGQLVRENRFGHWLRALGNSRFGRGSVSIDSTGVGITSASASKASSEPHSRSRNRA